MQTDLSEDTHFARLRAHFHALMEQDAGRRVSSLAALRQVDAVLAHELQGLLDCLDESDLQAPAAPALARRLGPFQLLYRVGRGGMGDVYLAERVEGGFEQRVALKVVRDTAWSSGAHRRFQRERQILARLQHPGIAHLVDGGIGPDGRPWLAMEYVDGERITEWCARQRLDVAARVRLFLPVCEAVQFAHRNLVVHRDLKPGNLLVGAEGRPKLLDFGIAHLLEPGDTERTQTSMPMTPAYAAPEQQQGGKITTATDVFQLGRLLQLLLAMETPAGAADEDIGTERLSRGRSTSGLRGDLARILAKAQAEAPSDRYASVAMLADDLRDWLDRRPLRSGIGSARAQTRFLLRRYRWPLGLAGAVLLALGLGAAVAWQQAQQARAQAEIARAHLQSLLDVLGSANPGRYAGREPSAVEFLEGAASALQRRAREQPELARRAMVEIAHTMINLGHPAEAEPVLQSALSAAEHDPGAGADARLAVLGLLMHAQSAPAAVQRARQSAEQIETLVASEQVGDAAAIDALARAAGTLSSQGEFAVAQRLFARADALLAKYQNKSISAGIVENYWRQRGWAALRGGTPGVAAEALSRSLDVIAAHPQAFSALRRAEGEVLLAEAELLDGRPEAARERFEAALPVLLDEYGPEHPERAGLHLGWMVHRLATADGAEVEAGLLHALNEAERVLQNHQPAYARDLVRASWLRVELALRNRSCEGLAHALAVARQRDQQLHPMLPREQAARMRVLARVQQSCGIAVDDEPAGR